MGWSFWPFGGKKEEEPPEQLVLGAELKCPYGSAHSFLMVEAESIDVNCLPNACVSDSKPFKDSVPLGSGESYGNIMPFGECMLRAPCKEIMELEEEWENPEPQTMMVNGKEIITTKSTLICRKSGMEIQAVNSGQDGEVARQWKEMSELLHETEEKYPGLLDILKDPYGSLYLEEGMYQKAIQFLEDCVERNDGKIDLAAVYAPKSLEANLMRLVLGRLLPSCDETRPESYLSVLEARGTVTEMYKNPNWDAHVINKEMIEMLWKDCADTAERIDTSAFYRFPEEHKWGTRIVGESIMGFGYGCVLYYATIADQSQPRRQNAKVEEKTTSDVVKTESNAGGEAETAGEGGTGAKKPYATSRPSYGKGQVEQVWENAKDPVTGKVYDPSGVEITWDPTKPRNGQWDMGHIPGEKYSEMHQLYMDDIITKDEFLEWYRNPDNYRPELPSTNRSHKYE